MPYNDIVGLLVTTAIVNLAMYVILAAMVRYRRK